MRIVFSILLSLVCVPLPSVLAQPPARIAFLLINTEYQKVRPLTADAAVLQELKSALTAAQFTVREERNLTQERLAKDLDPLLLSKLKPGDTLFFYYLGYAIQANGDNFLVPVDFDPKSTGPVSFGAHSLTGIVQALDEKKVGLKMILIDAAAQANELLAKATGTGLAEPDFPDIREFAYLSSTAKNALPAAFTDSERALFSKNMAALIRKPGTTLVDLMTGTQNAVSSANPKMNPYFSMQTTQPFRFTEPPPPPPVKVVDEFITRDRVNARDRQAYLYIPPGKFLMGCVPGDKKCEEHEKPQHEVTISKGFWMGETEVQVEAYQKFAESSTPKRKLPGAPIEHKNWSLPNLPMAKMSPADAMEFCKWVGGRLPTEAEWEYAARGGKANEIVPLNAENAREKANFSGKQGNDRFEEVAPVKKFDPNGFGLFDMFGNVWEMTSDFYGKTYFAESPKIDPTGPPTGKERVMRGGSWFSDPTQHLRISFRNKGEGGNIVGFRCVLTDSEETRKLLR